MAVVLSNLNSLPTLSGTETFLNIMTRSRLGIEDPELPIPGRPLRTLIRIIFTTITLPFFTMMGTSYNFSVAGSKLALCATSLIMRKYFRLSPASFYMNKGLYHLSMSILEFSTFAAFPLVAATYAFLPMELSKIYSGMIKWIEFKTVGP